MRIIISFILIAATACSSPAPNDTDNDACSTCRQPDVGEKTDTHLDVLVIHDVRNDPTIDTEPLQDSGEEDLTPDLSTGPFRALLFSKTSGFRHGSISNAIEAIDELAAQNDFTTEATEDASQFSDAGLEEFDVVVFVMTTGDVLDEEQQGALERFVQNGGGWVGIHSATDTEYDWEWYGNLVGAYFDGHPAIQNATVIVEDRTHISTAHLDAQWNRRDEWYNFRPNPRAAVHVLATLDEGTYDGGSMGDDHPIAWCHNFDGGRSWYTAGGHTSESYEEAEFRQHLLGGVLWAAGRAQSACD